MAMFRLGRWVSDRGRHREALTYLDKTVAAVTDGTALHVFVLGLAHREMGNTERSKEYGWLALRHAWRHGAMDLAAQIQAELSP